MCNIKNNKKKAERTFNPFGLVIFQCLSQLLKYVGILHRLRRNINIFLRMWSKIIAEDR